VRIPTSSHVDGRDFLPGNPAMSSICGVYQGVLSSSISPTTGSEEGFSGTSESGVIIQISPHGLDVVPVTLWVMGIIHVNICSIMFQMLTILLHGLTHSPPFMDGYLGLPE